MKSDSSLLLLDSFCDTDGNILAVLLGYNDDKILLEGIYGPNADSPEFYSDTVFSKINDWAPDYSIFVGDYNVVINPKKDTKNYLHVNNPNAMRELNNQISTYNLIDIWRDLHPDDNTYTWQKYNEDKWARLDFFLISSSLLPFVERAEIVPGFCSDHSAVTLEIDFERFRRGRGFWKFNSSLLKEPKYIERVKALIKRVVTQYSIVNEDPDFFVNASAEELKRFYDENTPESLQQQELKINPQTFLDILLLEIRSESISFSSKLKKERVAKEHLITEEIRMLETKMMESVDNASFRLDNAELQLKKEELDDLTAYQAQGAYIRARAKYHVEGERPTKLFCSLEKHNGVQKHIPKLLVDRTDGVKELSSQQEIEQEIYDYYSNLFEVKPTDVKNLEEFLSPEIDVPKLSNEEKEKQEGLLTISELGFYLKKTKNNTAPGSSGYTNEFYKFFWRDLKHFIIEAINYGYENGSLSITQRLGIVTLIPKGDKDKKLLKNWRPLTLLNSLYKMVSGSIAERMKPYLNKIINNDQKGFVSGRFIGEAVRTTYDIFQWAKEKKRSGILLLIDFEKAYDSLSFEYIDKCLKFFNFGDTVIRWVNILLKNFSGVINHCGNISKRFNIGRGARQGDPIASYLFIICIEILALQLRSDPTIKGFDLENNNLRTSNDRKVHLLELYADDCSIFLQPSAESLRRVVESLNSFFKISGLKISVAKTKAVWFGSECDTKAPICTDLNLDWSNNFKLLGVEFDNKLENMHTNFDIKLREIEKLFSCWMHRNLTVYGKIVVVKTLALSKLSHLALVLPTLEKQHLKKLERLVFNFIWNGKPDKVARDHARLPEKLGGLGLTDIKQFWNSLKFSWLRRMCVSKSFWITVLEKSLSEAISTSISILEFLQFGPKAIVNASKKLGNMFWKGVFCLVEPYMQGALFSCPESLVFAPFWDNSSITRNNKTIKGKSYPMLKDKIKTVSDFFNPATGHLRSKTELNDGLNTDIDEDTVVEIHHIIKCAFRMIGLKHDFKPTITLPCRPLLIQIANISQKGCNLYTKLLSKQNHLTANLENRENKWHIELNVTFGVDLWAKIYAKSAEIKYENKMKWLQFQINRNSLFTNVKVNKFKRHISHLCSLCGESPEQISHLFYHCSRVSQLLKNIQEWLASFNVDFQLDIIRVLFLKLDESPFSVTNFTILCFKNFIWRAKFSQGEVILPLFLNYFFSKLKDLKEALIYCNKMYEFDRWNSIFNYLHDLSRIRPRIEQHVEVEDTGL